MQPPPPTGVPAAPIPPAGAKITILPEYANGLRKRDGCGNPACRPHHPDFFIFSPAGLYSKKNIYICTPFRGNRFISMIGAGAFSEGRSPGGGIGRHATLRGSAGLRRVSSSLVLGTNNEKAAVFSGFFVSEGSAETRFGSSAQGLRPSPFRSTGHTCHTSWLCVSPATCSLTPVASTAAKSGTNAASVINTLRFPLIFFPQSNGGTNMRTMDGTG